MKKLSTYIISFLCLLIFISPSYALNRKIYVYSTSQPTEVRTKVLMATTLLFETSVEWGLAGDNGCYDVKMDNSKKKISITPKRDGGITNLTVFYPDGRYFVFILNVVKMDQDSDYVLEIKSIPDVDISDLIKITNRRKVDLDPGVLDMIQMYDATEESKTELPGMNFKVYFKRATVFEPKNKVVLWIRLENTAPILGNNADLRFAWDKTKIKDFIVKDLCFERGSTVLHNSDIEDLYFILDASSTNNNYTITYNINGKNYDLTLSNIPYDKVLFHVYHYDGSGYSSFEINDYQR